MKTVGWAALSLVPYYAGLAVANSRSIALTCVLVAIAGVAAATIASKAAGLPIVRPRP